MTTLRHSRDGEQGRKCIFCGCTANSQEHTFANWLNDVFGPEEVGPTGAELFRATPDETEVFTWTAGEIAGQTVKGVCHSCNTGWMAQLEGRAKPVLEPMVKGGVAQFLDARQQILIATWATKSAMVCERMLDGPYEFASHDRRIVMEQDRPPGHVLVYASSVQTDVGPLRFSQAAGELATTDRVPTEVILHLYTLQVGTLVLQVMRGDPPADVARTWADYMPERDRELPLFPPLASGLYWPTKRVLNESEFLAYTRRMAGLGPPPLLPPGSHVWPQ